MPKGIFRHLASYLRRDKEYEELGRLRTESCKEVEDKVEAHGNDHLDRRI